MMMMTTMKKEKGKGPNKHQEYQDKWTAQSPSNYWRI